MTNKVFWIGGLAVVAILGIGVSCFAAGTGQNSTIRSRNTVKYQSENGSVEIWSRDIKLLADKVSTVPSGAFDPATYTHVHSWQYIDINESTHTKHCTSCGFDQDIIAAHRDLSREAYDISYDGETFSGYQHTCECGYKWIDEANHVYTYSYVDDGKHEVDCALSASDYCPDFYSYNEEHLTNEIEPNDVSHHTITCICGYSWTEECDFTSDAVEDDDAGKALYCCSCGNSTTEDPDDDIPAIGEKDDEDDTDLSEDAVAETEQP